MLTNRCICCNAELTEYESKWDDILGDYNDMCNFCLRTARNLRTIDDDSIIKNMRNEYDEEKTTE